MSEPLSKEYPIIREMILYGFIGIVSAATDSGLYYIFTRFASLNVILSNFISVNVGITISFLLNTFITFRKTNKLGKRAISFYGVGYVGLAISTFLLYVGVHFLGLHDLMVKLSSVIIVAAFQFVLNKMITYGKIK